MIKRHLSHHGIHLGQSHCFPCAVIVDQECECFHDDFSYDEFGHMGLQIGLSLLLEKGEEFFLRRTCVLDVYLFLLKSFGLDPCL